MLSSIIMHEWMNRYHEGLPNPETMPVQPLYGQEGFPGEGPYLRLALTLEGQIIREVWFETYPCPAAIACGSLLARWLEGRALEEAEMLTEPGISQMVGGLPLGKEHCARITACALKSALRQLEDIAPIPMSEPT